jgi:hypothetical protein
MLDESHDAITTSRMHFAKPRAPSHHGRGVSGPLRWPIAQRPTETAAAASSAKISYRSSTMLLAHQFFSTQPMGINVRFSGWNTLLGMDGARRWLISLAPPPSENSECKRLTETCKYLALTHSTSVRGIRFVIVKGRARVNGQHGSAISSCAVWLTLWSYKGLHVHFTCGLDRESIG